MRRPGAGLPLNKTRNMKGLDFIGDGIDVSSSRIVLGLTAG